ncbi:acyl-CoA dehydrogenase family protein [Sphingomonas sp. KR3-1]|uniref:acyl-CoA dehydrogenase family protein n=1 Tax=Sphingomonas sp. KR3-1 TaxID=3156611 RepID=UPI0032B61651
MENKAATRDWIAEAKVIAAEIEAYADRHDAEGSFVSEGYARLKEAGFFKALVPDELGGGGADFAEIFGAIRILGAACGSTALAFSMHTHLVAAAVWRREHQAAPTEGLLRRVAAEDLILVSSGGSDWLESAGTAEKVEGGFRITARKPFSSGCEMGDLLMTSAVYDDPEAGPSVLHFGVPLKAEGVTIADSWHVLGMRGTGSHDLVLDRVFVADAAIGGRRPQGKWHMLFHVIGMIAFGSIYSAYMGVADGARRRALEIARTRTPDAHLLHRVGAMENAHAAAELALREMVDLACAGQPSQDTTNRIMICRTLLGDAAIETVTRAMDVAGGAAFYRKAGLERAFRDVQGARFHPLQKEPQLAFAGRVALGLDIDG